jgi:hypothetical protein
MCPHCLFRQSPTLGLKHPIADVRRALGAHPCAAPVQSDRHVPGAPHPSAEADHCRVLGVVPVAILREVPGSAQAHLKSLPPGKLPSSHLRRTGQPCASRLPNSAQSTRDGSRPGVNRPSGCHWPSMPGGRPDHVPCRIMSDSTASSIWRRRSMCSIPSTTSRQHCFSTLPSPYPTLRRRGRATFTSTAIPCSRSALTRHPKAPLSMNSCR